MKIRMLFIWTLAFLTLPLIAQKRKAVPLTPEQLKQQQRQEKIARMMAKTQRIIFIDSIVVDKQHFLQAYHLSPEVGRVASYNDFFHTNRQPDAHVYVNELGSRCYYSMEQADSTMQLYASDNINNRWSRPHLLSGINEDSIYHRINYPFMMGDGETFYFAAESNDALGGYDIYVTRYDEEEKQFLHPANIGMPFNSEANDYLYAIDEYNNLGWFATDRRQPADSVCIYVFIPPQTRQTYDTDSLTASQLANLACISRIADTWSDEDTRQAALSRLKNAMGRKPVSTDGDICFIVDDHHTYTRLSDFQAAGNKQRYQQLTTLQDRYQRLLDTLDRARDHYATANQEERDELRPDILASERMQHDLYLQIHQLEKTIRNNEILFLTKNI